MTTTPDLILLGPAPPYRGGIADTQWQFAKELQRQKKSVLLWTFTQLYPAVLFPGKTQFSTETYESSVPVERKIHAYTPWQWKQIAQAINTLSPKAVVFRYWTPFLSPCWSSIAKHLNPKIKRIALVDNWKPHEPRLWDAWLNKKFEKQMDAFSCLSATVKEEISSETMKPCWGKMHPIAENLPPKHKKDEARTALGLEVDKQYLLFFGLIRPYKGLDLLLHALAEHPDKKLLIVGECYEAIEKYTRLIKQLGLEAQIELQNRFVTIKEAAQYFSAADALVLPYKSATQSGVVAMAYHYQLPMVVTNHPGLSHAIENDKTGIVCAPTAKEISTALATLFSGTHIENAKQNLEENKNNYSWKNYTQEWVNFALNE